MPKVKIDMREGKSEAYKKQLLDLVHESLVEAIKIPDHDRNQIIREHKPVNFEISPGKTDNFISIEIVMFQGRSLEAKRNLYRSIVEKLKGLGIEEYDVMVTLIEPPLENWGITGKPASEIDLGFKVDV